MTPKPSRFALIIVAALTGLLAATGCGDDPESSQPPDNDGQNTNNDSSEPPEVKTLSPEAVTIDAATLRGKITAPGEPPATEHGFCTGTDPEPDNCEPSGAPDDDGIFEATFEELAPGQTYVVRAYAENEVDRVYGGDVTFGVAWDAVVSGDRHTCAIAEGGTLWCWGNNSWGQLGVGDEVPRTSPIQIGSEDWRAVSLGERHTCAVGDDDTLWCWGSGAYGQLGQNDTEEYLTPAQVGGGDDWRSVSAGTQHTCATRNNNTLWCWGSGISGRLGVGDTDPREVPEQVGSDGDWQSVSAGNYHSCGLRNDDSLWCWGSGIELGLDGTDQTSVPEQIDAHEWSDVHAANGHTCGVRNDDTLWCWGNNFSGQLGHGDTDDYDSPEQVGFDSNWRSVSTRDRHTCAVRLNDTLWCWGNGSSGRLGLGTTTDHQTPRQVATERGFNTVSTGGEHTCGLVDDGKLKCWGSQVNGRLGTGIDGGNKNAPYSLAVDKSLTDIAAGNLHGCGLTTDNELWCWGFGGSGRLGIGEIKTHVSPQQVDTGAENWRALSAGERHTCALGSDDTLWCWGNNYDGELGLSDTAERDAPEQVGADTNWNQITTGQQHTCALRGDGQLWCWGYNRYGNLGLGYSYGDHHSPERVGDDDDWTDISAGADHTCGVRDAGTLWCWGDGDEGKLGLGDTEDYDAPEQIGFDANWRQVSAAEDHTCAVRTNGTLWCWGLATSGRLGIGDINELGNYRIEAPEQVGDADAWDSVIAGGEHTCGIRDDSTLWCWGRNNQGQVGVGDFDSRLTPEQVGDDDDWSVVSAGDRHTHGVRSDGSGWSWGSNTASQLGDDTRQVLEPVSVP